MFTGVIEATALVTSVCPGDQSLKVFVNRPAHFQDISIGDSMACNGVCLTLEKLDQHKMGFTMGQETLQITGWKEESLRSALLNLERPLRLGDRIHGHLVSGHVDTSIQVVKKEKAGDCLILSFGLPGKQSSEIRNKSCVAIHGVSLTVNHVGEKLFQVCLIPETLRKTNLKALEPGDWVNLETDHYVKGLLALNS